MFGFLKNLKYVPLKSVMISALVAFSLALVTVGFVVAQDGITVQQEQINIDNNDTLEQTLTPPLEETGEVAGEVTGVVNVANDDALKVAIQEQKSGFSVSLNAIARGLLGIVVLLAIAFLLSKNRKAINWKTVLIALGLQIF